jgi:hypothetical protein
MFGTCTVSFQKINFEKLVHLIGFILRKERREYKATTSDDINTNNFQIYKIKFSITHIISISLKLNRIYNNKNRE